MRGTNRLNDRESETRAAQVARPDQVNSEETVKDMRQRFGRYARTGIADLEHGQTVAGSDR